MSTESIAAPTARTADPDAKGAARLRHVVAAFVFVYGLALSGLKVASGNFPTWFHVAIFLLAIALYSGRGGRFARDWLPVTIIAYAYTLAGNFTTLGHFSVHYLPQIDIDRVIGFGELPTTWLQQHLYAGRTGPLEIFSTLAYTSHFLVPPLIAGYVWLRRGEAFHAYLWTILTVSILADITFVLAPTAPPWLAADHGLIPHVHHVIKQSLYDLHMTGMASMKDRPGTYDITAAVPSLHAAWPVVGMLVARHFRLPRWVRITLVVQWAAVVFAIVYCGEHYVTDALVGALYAYGSYRLVLRLLGRREARRGGAVLAAGQSAS